MRSAESSNQFIDCKLSSYTNSTLGTLDGMCYARIFSFSFEVIYVAGCTHFLLHILHSIGFGADCSKMEINNRMDNKTFAHFFGATVEKIQHLSLRFEFSILYVFPKNYFLTWQIDQSRNSPGTWKVWKIRLRRGGSRGNIGRRRCRRWGGLIWIRQWKTISGDPGHSYWTSIEHIVIARVHVPCTQSSREVEAAWNNIPTCKECKGQRTIPKFSVKWLMFAH